MSDNWPGGFISAEEFRDDEPDKDVTVFSDETARYCTSDERSKEWLYIENMPSELENKC